MPPITSRTARRAVGRPWPPLEERFWANVDKDSHPEGCWTWTGYFVSGYGSIFGNGRPNKAHRLSYEWLVGPIPEGLVIDHLCRNTTCVNPEHLEPVTFWENVQRGTLPDRVKGVYEAARQKTHCKRGHPLSGDNLYRQGNKRACQTCRRELSRQAYYRNRGKVCDNDNVD